MPVLAVVALSITACSRVEPFENLMDIGECDPETAGFTLEIDNPFFPLPVGRQLVLEGRSFFFKDELVRITVLDEVETVAGVETRVVEEYEEEDGRVVEVSRNYFAQTNGGTVCYFGEEVDIYDSEGNITSHGGGWRADGANVPGIFMPADLAVGQAFQQEIAPGIAEDQAKVIALGEVTEVPAGTFEDTATLLDQNPLDGGQDEKVYAVGVGLIVDGSVRLTSVT
ncbi:MAG: hypothetical protein ACXWXN_06635 [Actinomycetota bacterium]